MPLGPGVRYRMGPHGVRLAFRGNKVVEAKNMKSGATHTPAEFAKDRKGGSTRRPGSSAATNLRSHPQSPQNKRDLMDDMVHSNIVGLLRGVGENFT